jgi:hypothetical protein
MAETLYWIRVWDVPDTKPLLELALGPLPGRDPGWDGKRRGEVRASIERRLAGTGLEAAFDEWDRTEYWLLGTEEKGLISVIMSTVVDEGGPGMNDSVKGESFYITTDDAPLVVATYGYTHQGCFIITNDRAVRDKVEAHYAARGRKAWIIEWTRGPGRADDAPWIHAGYRDH